MQSLLRTWPALVVLALLLIADVFCIAHRSRFPDLSITGQLFSLRGFGIPRATPWSHGGAIVISQEEGQLVVTPQEIRTFDARVGAIRLTPRRFRFGVHASVATKSTLEFSSWVVAGHTHDVDSLRRQFINQRRDRILASYQLTDTDFEHLITTGSYSKTTILPLGIAHDAITLTTLILLIWSIRLNLARVREAKRLRASQCPNCRYSIVGLPTNTCPECGHEFARCDETNPA